MWEGIFSLTIFVHIRSHPNIALNPSQPNIRSSPKIRSHQFGFEDPPGQKTEKNGFGSKNGEE